MAEEIIEAAFKEASETDFKPMFIATPRQVDAQRGYTGWSQKELKKFLEKTSEKHGYKGDYYVARDHGGPYQSMRDRGNEDVELETAMKYAKEVFHQDIEAGFDIIHIDATEDPTVDEVLDLEETAKRTSELIKDVEEKRKKENKEIFYEVGTEEISGGMTDTDSFEKFIKLLKEKTEKKDVADGFKRIIFIVGQVGTRMKIAKPNQFNPDKAEELVNIASSYDMYLKVHYTDWLKNEQLKRFPEKKIGAANVGPEFAASKIEALEKLEEKEKEIIDSSENKSEFMKTLEKKSIEKAPWERFSPNETEEKEKFAKKHSRDIAICVGRYVLNDKEVSNSIDQLYKNLKKSSEIKNPNKFIVNEIQKSIHRYVNAFNY